MLEVHFTPWFVIEHKMFSLSNQQRFIYPFLPFFSYKISTYTLCCISFGSIVFHACWLQIYTLETHIICGFTIFPTKITANSTSSVFSIFVCCDNHICLRFRGQHHRCTMSCLHFGFWLKWLFKFLNICPCHFLCKHCNFTKTTTIPHIRETSTENYSWKIHGIQLSASTNTAREMRNIYYICMSVYMHNKLLSFDKSAFKSDSSLGRLNVYLKKLFHFTSLILDSGYFHKILPFYLKWLVSKWKSIVRMNVHTNDSISFANELSVAANMK